MEKGDFSSLKKKQNDKFISFMEWGPREGPADKSRLVPIRGLIGGRKPLRADPFGLSRASLAQLSLKNQYGARLPAYMLSAVIRKYVATWRCNRHYNQYTIGISFPVLAY
jgi:hypothetical protein